MSLLTTKYLITELQSIKLMEFTEDQSKDLNKKAKFILEESIPKQQSLYSRGKVQICIAHNIKDEILLASIISMFELNGFAVYLFWIDDLTLMEQPVSMYKTEKFKSIIRSSKVLLYAFTTENPLNDWANWFLSYGEGKLNKTALLPISDKEEESYSIPDSLWCNLHLQLQSFENGTVELCVYETPSKWCSLSSWINLGGLFENPLNDYMSKKNNKSL
jgi:hypothetical protein